MILKSFSAIGLICLLSLLYIINLLLLHIKRLNNYKANKNEKIEDDSQKILKIKKNKIKNNNIDTVLNELSMIQLRSVKNKSIENEEKEMNELSTIQLKSIKNDLNQNNTNNKEESKEKEKEEDTFIVVLVWKPSVDPQNNIYVNNNENPTQVLKEKKKEKKESNEIISKLKIAVTSNEFEGYEDELNQDDNNNAVLDFLESDIDSEFDSESEEVELQQIKREKSYIMTDDDTDNNNEKETENENEIYFDTKLHENEIIQLFKDVGLTKKKNIKPEYLSKPDQKKLKNLKHLNMNILKRLQKITNNLSIIAIKNNWTKGLYSNLWFGCQCDSV